MLKLHKKTFPELTTAELYDLLRIRSEVSIGRVITTERGKGFRISG